VGTTSLLSSGRLEPRKVIGSIDTSEFVVAAVAWVQLIVIAVRAERRRLSRKTRCRREPLTDLADAGLGEV